MYRANDRRQKVQAKLDATNIHFQITKRQTDEQGTCAPCLITPKVTLQYCLSLRKAPCILCISHSKARRPFDERLFLLPKLYRQNDIRRSRIDVHRISNFLLDDELRSLIAPAIRPVDVSLTTILVQRKNKGRLRIKRRLISKTRQLGKWFLHT